MNVFKTFCGAALSSAALSTALAAATHDLNLLGPLALVAVLAYGGARTMSYGSRLRCAVVGALFSAIVVLPSHALRPPTMPDANVAGLFVANGGVAALTIAVDRYRQRLRPQALGFWYGFAAGTASQLAFPPDGTERRS